MKNRVAPMSPTLRRLLEVAEAELEAALADAEDAYQAGGTLARMRWDARPHPKYRARGNGWTDPWKEGEYEKALDAALDRFDAEHRGDAEEIEMQAADASARYNAACARLAVLLP